MPYNDKAPAFQKFAEFVQILDEFMQNNSFIFTPPYQDDEKGQEFVYERVYYGIKDDKTVTIDISDKEVVFQWLNRNIKRFNFYIMSGKNKKTAVKKVCEKLNITQKELAKLMGVSEGMPAKWAMDDNPPRWAIVSMGLLLDNKDLREKLDKLKTFKNLLDAL
jgi:hypothetical protein